MSSWALYQEGMQIEWFFSFSERELSTFADLSADFNPIHTSREFARAKGFDDRLVYGLLLASQMSTLIGEKLPDSHSVLTGIQMDFVKPSYTNEKLKFVASLVQKSDAAHALEFKCKIVRDVDILCKGRVAAVWRP